MSATTVMPDTCGNAGRIGSRDSPFSIAALISAPVVSSTTMRLSNGSSASTSRRVMVVPGG